MSATLDLVGDRWSMVVLRDVVVGKRRFSDFLGSPEGITTNILADRLERLHQDGLIEKRPYQTKPVRYDYFLTRKGADFLPILQQMARWGHAHVPGSWSPPDWFLEARPEDLLTDREGPEEGEPPKPPSR